MVVCCHEVKSSARLNWVWILSTYYCVSVGLQLSANICSCRRSGMPLLSTYAKTTNSPGNVSTTTKTRSRSIPSVVLSMQFEVNAGMLRCTCCAGAGYHCCLRLRELGAASVQGQRPGFEEQAKKNISASIGGIHHGRSWSAEGYHLPVGELAAFSTFTVSLIGVVELLERERGQDCRQAPFSDVLTFGRTIFLFCGL